MSTAREVLWGDLARTWQAGPAVDRSQIRRLADRQTTLMRLTVVGEVAVTLAALAVVWWIGEVERGAVALGWAVATGLHTAVVWVFSIWNRIGVWRPLGQATVDYLRLAQERCRRQQRAANFTLGLVGVEVAALAAWLALAAADGRAPRSAARWVPAAAVTGSAIWFALWYRARAARQLARLEVLESQLAREGGGM